MMAVSPCIDHGVFPFIDKRRYKKYFIDNPNGREIISQKTFFVNNFFSYLTFFAIYSILFV